jgi:UPF0755 protein
VIRKATLLLLLLALTLLLVKAEIESRWRQPLALPAQGLRIAVLPGDSLRAVAERLHRDGVLAHPQLLSLYARWTGLDQQIKHGEYLLEPVMTAQTLLELLASGRVIQYQVTLPEGITLAQALAILQQQDELEATLSGPDDARLLELAGPYGHPEGLFFPDTYHYSRGATDWQILQRAHSAMQGILETEWQDRDPELPYEEAYEALIMASIIERETGLPEEREQIAGVFVRRLQRGMRLQTDPTVIYGVGHEFDGNLRRAHLQDEDNAYNTYRHEGLPPSPIALPGRASIRAALHPAPGEALFFVARGDGGHVFSVTLAEHEAAVRQYQLRRRQDYRSSPEQP